MTNEPMTFQNGSSFSHDRRANTGWGVFLVTVGFFARRQIRSWTNDGQKDEEFFFKQITEEMD